MSYKKDLRKLVRTRLHDDGDNKIFTKKLLNKFIDIAESAVATYTRTEVLDLFVHKDLIVNYVVILCLGAQALLEKGREYPMSDNGVEFTPPDVSTLLQEQYKIEYEVFFRKINIYNDKP